MSDVTAHDLIELAEEPEPETALTAIGRLRGILDELEGSAVARAKVEGWPWSRIGSALGVSKQAAWARYADPEERAQPTKPAHASRKSNGQKLQEILERRAAEKGIRLVDGKLVRPSDPGVQA